MSAAAAKVSRDDVRYGHQGQNASGSLPNHQQHQAQQHHPQQHLSPVQQQEGVCANTGHEQAADIKRDEKGVGTDRSLTADFLFTPGPVRSAPASCSSSSSSCRSSSSCSSCCSSSSSSSSTTSTTTKRSASAGSGTCSEEERLWNRPTEFWYTQEQLLIAGAMIVAELRGQVGAAVRRTLQ